MNNRSRPVQHQLSRVPVFGPVKGGMMEAAIELAGTTMTRSRMTERVLADAHRSFASGIDVDLLQGQIAQIVDDLWTETTKVTTFIPVLALRDLRERVESQREGRGF